MGEIVEKERHERRYARSEADVLRSMERDVLGSDYHANGYTTRAQADRLGALLDLAPDRVLLDVGSGCGWPGLYLADRYECTVVVIDPVTAGVVTARRRAINDNMAERTWAVAGAAEDLPLRSRSVDAIVHTDVMC